MKHAKRWLLYIGVALTPAASCHSGKQEVIVAKPVLLNTNQFGDRQNSSSLPVDGRPDGNVAWEKPSIIADQSQPALQLAIYDSTLLVSYGSVIDARRLENGEPIWHRPIGGSARFDLKPEGLVTLDPAGFYQLLNTDQKLNEPLSLPFLSSNSVLFYSRRFGDEMLYCYKSIPTPTNSPGDEFGGPNLALYRFNISTNSFSWQFHRPENVTGVIESHDGSRIAVATAQNLYLLPADAKSDSAVSIITFPRLLSCSYDRAGLILVVVELPPEEGGVTLKAIGPDHETTWKLSFGEATVSPQPPATSPDGTVYLIVDAKLHCIRSGETIWSVPAPGSTEGNCLTVLKDGTLLLAAGMTLMHISSAGSILMNKPLKDTVTCRPIMDARGRIYVAGRHSVTCIE